MLYSVVIPSHNEEGSIAKTVTAVTRALIDDNIDYEIIVVNDNSHDQTVSIIERLHEKDVRIKLVENSPPHGFGTAVRTGLETMTGDAVVIVMADASDDPSDIVAYYRILQKGYDCVFGSRFIQGSHVENYPLHKFILNRFTNLLIRILFGFHYNDVTNAFKCYRTEVIRGIHPILSHHFNLTVELPLKAIVRGYNYAVLPIQWYGRSSGISKLKIREMGSRYLFIILYVWLERWLARGDYHRRSHPHDLHSK